MKHSRTIWNSPVEYLRNERPDFPVAFFCPDALQEKARQFLHGFPGQVTYAVKANPAPEVLANLVAAGIEAFDVASPEEMEQVRSIAPDAPLHYNNPVRSRAEIGSAISARVVSCSVDSFSELAKLAGQFPPGTTEIAVRFRLPLDGAAYDFGTKFGTDLTEAIELLQRVESLGYAPALCFHPGTQCTAPGVWKAYISAAAEIVGKAGVAIGRLNVGGGFPSHRLSGQEPHLEAIFSEIADAAKQAFGNNQPQLLCEPGRAMVGDAYCLAARVKAIRDGKDVFLNDGFYGGLSELVSIGPLDRLEIISPEGEPRLAEPSTHAVFGPTCDSIDKLSDATALPSDMEEGDYIIFQGIGAYSTCLTTRFNGYGLSAVENVASLSG
ncbi:MAG TPA: type III PLP-dependent enzyme [Devosia sp.]|nr:type III PLP-dependent enzyme [Devosia sp.]